MESLQPAFRSSRAQLEGRVRTGWVRLPCLRNTGCGKQERHAQVRSHRRPHGRPSALSREEAPRRRRGPRLSREDGASRERLPARLPVAIAAGDEGGRGEGALRVAAERRQVGIRRPGARPGSGPAPRPSRLGAFPPRPRAATAAGVSAAPSRRKLVGAGGRGGLAGGRAGGQVPLLPRSGIVAVRSLRYKNPGEGMLIRVRGAPPASVPALCGSAAWGASVAGSF